MSIRHASFGLLSLSLLAFPLSVMGGAPFDCGSDGSDGALSFPPSGSPTTVIFDPAGLGIDSDGDGIYHFTTITIPLNVTVQVRAPYVGWQPIHWLATGNIEIAGVLDLDGDAGHAAHSTIFHTPSIPGPGGYPGGIGQSQHQTATAGLGPQGGAANSSSGAHQTYGNLFLQPLTGGSGAGGGFVNPQAGGGAGGGAILLASNTSANIAGTVRARGGAPGAGNGGGFGAGGGIRIVAPTISGGGSINAGAAVASSPLYGRVRLESFADTFTGGITGLQIRRTTLLADTYTPPVSGSNPRVRVATVDGVAVPSTPFGSFEMPDVEIDDGGTITFVIEASNIPVGTVVKLWLFGETSMTQTIDSTATIGTFENSTATATATLQQGFTRGFPYATWN